MPKYARLDLSQTPPLVIGWYDTDALDYPNLPDLGELAELSPEDWANRMSEPRWVVVDGALVALPPEPPSPAVAASMELSARIAVGIVITSVTAPALNATYALDALTMEQVGSVARDYASGLGLPGDAATFTYPDATGMPRTFTGGQLSALYRKQRNLLSVLHREAAMMANGAQPSWPSQSAEIG